jgi:cytochrome c oxidase cbb3-type subunit 3/ubiquinol-cytochrome c reductase cytochrome c subunit
MGLPGAPKSGVEVPRPDSITDFAMLYGQNCAGCHGDHGQNGASLDLANPFYQAWVSDATLQKIIANGEPGAQMPAFAKSAGGFLTDTQVDALVHGMRSDWRKPGALKGTPPSYTPGLTSNAAHGQQVYKSECAMCHEKPRMSITDPTFLALVNDQTLRTIVVAGRPDLGMPDWEDDIHEHPLTDQEVTDVVAWLASQRTQTPGQPYPHPQ